MRLTVFSTRPYDRQFLSAANAAGTHDLRFLEPRLSVETVALADGEPGVCVFVNDVLDRSVLDVLAAGGTRLIALRCAGFNNVDLPAAREFGLRVVRVPAYSPHAVAEHTFALILALNRRVHRAYNRVREQNFSLDGLVGFDLHGKTIGVVGTGAIGVEVVRIAMGFGCRVLASDPSPSADALSTGASFVDLATLLAESDVVTLHCPLVPETRHIVNAESLARMRRGVMLVNTSRGALVDTRAAIDALKSGHLGYLGIDVYEEEASLFFEDRSSALLADDVFARLLTFPNVVVTGHQGFLTHEALRAIAETTLASVSAFEAGEPLAYEIQAPA